MNEEIESLTTLDRIKKHFADNWKTYLIAGGTAIVVGGLSYIVYRNSTTNIRLNAGRDIIGTQIIHNTTTYGGYQQKLVERLEDGKLFGSVTEAAEAAGVTVPTMSNHLNGRKDHIFDDHYRIVGLGTRP